MWGCLGFALHKVYLYWWLPGRGVGHSLLCLPQSALDITKEGVEHAVTVCWGLFNRCEGTHCAHHFPNCLFNAGSLKSTVVASFTPWKIANAGNRLFFFSSLWSLLLAFSNIVPAINDSLNTCEPGVRVHFNPAEILRFKQDLVGLYP